MKKTLKYWNGRGQGRYWQAHINVAAYSQKQAAELVAEACKSPCSIGEIRKYYSNCWGDSMYGITPDGPAVYMEEDRKQQPKRVL